MSRPYQRAGTIALCLGLSLSLGACYSVEYPDHYLCQDDPSCPSGQECRSGRCVAVGSSYELGTDQTQMDQTQMDQTQTDRSRVDLGPLPDSTRDLGVEGIAPDLAMPSDLGVPWDTTNDIKRDTTNDIKQDTTNDASDGSMDQSDGGGVVLFEDDFSDQKLDPNTWNYWLLEFEEALGKLFATGPVRAGFNYGHDGAGRGATVMTHIGDASWTDYRLEVDIAATGLGSFNPYSIASCYKHFAIHFRVQAAAESWNTAASSRYSLGVFAADCNSSGTTYRRGDWSLSRANDYYIPGTGWHSNFSGHNERVHPASGYARSSAIVDRGNRIKVEVRGINIKVFAWDATTQVFELLIDIDDTDSKALLSGGIGFSWGFEGLGWIDNVKVTKL